MVSKHFEMIVCIQENLIVFTLGDFSNKTSNKVLKLFKENKIKPQILDTKKL